MRSPSMRIRSAARRSLVLLSTISDTSEKCFAHSCSARSRKRCTASCCWIGRPLRISFPLALVKPAPVGRASARMICVLFGRLFNAQSCNLESNPSNVAARPNSVAISLTKLRCAQRRKCSAKLFFFSSTAIFFPLTRLGATQNEESYSFHLTDRLARKSIQAIKLPSTSGCHKGQCQTKGVFQEIGPRLEKPGRASFC